MVPDHGPEGPIYPNVTLGLQVGYVLWAPKQAVYVFGALGSGRKGFWIRIVVRVLGGA